MTRAAVPSARTYLSFFRMRFIAGLQYRAAALAGIATQFAWGFMEILAFKAFYETDPTAFPMTFRQLSSYIWMQQAFLALFMVWFFDKDIFALIESGDVAYELARPADIYALWFVKNLAARVSRAVLRCFPIFAVAAFLPDPYGMSFPADLPSALLFIPTMLLSALTVVAFCMIVYALSFRTISSMGIRAVAASLSELLSGAVVPIPFFPEPVRRVVELTPFASMQNLPLRIYTGNIAGADAQRAVIIQLFWLAALVIIGRLLLSRAIRRAAIQGG